MKLFFHHIFIALKMEGTSLSSWLSLRPSVNRTNLAPVRCQMAQTQPRRCCLPGCSFQPGMAFWLAAQGQHHPRDWCGDKGWPLALQQAVPTTAPGWTRGSCTPRFEMVSSRPRKPGGVGSGAGVLGLHEHEEGESPVLLHSAPIGPYGKKWVFSLVITPSAMLQRWHISVC